MPRLSLKFRITVTMFLLQAAILGAVLTQALSSYLDGSREQLQQQELAALDLIEGFARTALLTSQYDDIQPQLEQLTRNEFIELVVLADEWGIIVAASEPGWVTKSLVEMKDYANYPQLLWKERVLTNAAGPLGMLGIAFSEAPLLALHDQVQALAVGWSAGGLMLILLASLLSAHVLTRRLGRITEAASAVAGGDLGARSGVTGNDEIAELGHVFDSMVSSIRIERDRLAEREQHLSLTLDSIGDGVIVTDAEGRITRMNPVAVSLTGWREEEARGRLLPEVFHIVSAITREPMDNPVDKVLESHHIVALAEHTLLIGKDGHEYQIADSGAPIIDDHGNTLGIILVFRDVTDEYAQREALSMSQKMLSEAQRISHVGSWELEPRHDRLSWSEETYRICELDPDSLSHLTGEQLFAAHIDYLRRIVHPEDLPLLDEAYIKSVKERTPFEIRYRLLMPDGRIKYVHGRGETVYDSDGTPLRSIGTVQDVTERTLVEQELAAYRSTLEERVAARTAELLTANKELEAFAYSVSHDLRAPLRAIHGFSQILQEDYGQLLDDEGRDYLRRVCANTTRMGELIDDLLSLSRISRYQLDISTVSLTRLAREVSDTLQRQDPGRQARFEIQDDVSARGDLSLLRIVLVNLLGNAWKYTSKSDNVRIEFGRCWQGGVQAFFVRDNGVGFDSQYASQLFIPFQRLHAENEFEGTGIGLATVQRIVQRHGGRIWAESEPGQGATFYFTLDPA